MSKGFARPGWSRSSESIEPANFVASATPNVKGAWEQIDASTARDLVGLHISSSIGITVVATDTSTLLDIGIGAAAAETVVVANIPVGHVASGVGFFLPLYIPAGTRIAGRIQSVIGSKVYGSVVIECFGSRPGSWGGYSIADTIGVDTATSAPTVGDLTDNAWTEAIASTANAYRAFTFHPCGPAADVDMQTANIVVDIGYGTAGSEVSIGSFRVRTSANEQIQTFVGPPFLEASVSAGSRLAIRKNSTSDLSGALIGWR